MPYITREDLETRYGIDEIAELLDDDHDGSESSTETQSLQPAIDDACTIIDGYVSSRYSLPLVSVPPIIKAWACDIARFKLWDESAPEEVRQRYDDVLAQLKDLARGLINLPPGVDGTQPSGAGGAGYSNRRLFTERTLRDF